MNQFILTYLILINLLTFIAFKLDKILAKKHKSRISELKLLFLILIGGTFGGVSGIYILKHKSSKKTFLLKLLIIVGLQSFTIVYLINSNL